MLIGGVERTSFCDFPGKIAAVVFTQGCNFNCPFCHNPQLIRCKTKQQTQLDDKYILSFLAKRKNHLDGIVLSGGEPTIQSDLDTFLDKIKNMGFQTKLDTNGSQPEVVESLLEKGLLDFIAMDIKAPWVKYDRLCGCNVNLSKLRKCIRLITQCGIPYQFRTTWYKKLLSEADLKTIADQIPVSGNHVIQDFQTVRKE